MVELSIIVLNYNTKDLTIDCLDSIRKEGSKASKEVIVSDNASKDNSISAFKKYKSKYKDLKIRIIRNKKNLGFAKANNIAIQSSKGKYKLLLNSDTVVKKKCFDKLLKFAKKQKDVGVVGPRLLNTDGSVQGSVNKFPGVINAIKEYWFDMKGSFELYYPEVKKPIEVDAVVGAAFFITPKALDKVGLLNEKYFFYYEDLDYCRRVWNSGLRVYYYPDAEVVHYHGASGKGIVGEEFQWRRLIPSSKIYHGALKHYLISFIIRTHNLWQKLLKTF
jgi:GT2 family glycosyltransferase